MPRNLRRLYSLFAVLVFCLVAPFVVAWTSGYEWTGWRSGWTKVGALYITSEPRAEVWLNDQLIGTTPQRLNRLSSGTYTVSLKKTGYRQWRHTIKIQSGVAQVIGPVFLYPAEPTIVATDITATALADPTHSVVAAVTAAGSSWTITPQWPSVGRATTLPWQPTALYVHPSTGALAYRRDHRLAIVTRDRIQAWETTVTDAWQWGSGADSIGYGLDSGWIYRYDALTATRTKLATADSMMIVNDVLWLTRRNGGTTTIATLSAYGQTEPTLVLQLAGSYRLLDESSAVLLQNTVTKSVARLQRSTLTGQVTSTDYGAIDTWWSLSPSNAPLWRNGSELWTLGDHGAPLLLDRYSTPIDDAAWIVNGRIVMIIDQAGLRFQSVSAEQGRETVFQWAGQNVRLLGLSVSAKTAIVRSGNGVVQVRW